MVVLQRLDGGSVCQTDQINVLTPLNTITGKSSIVVNNNGATSAPFSVSKLAITPTLLRFDAQHVTATHLDFGIVGPPALFSGVSTPAQPGESIIVFGTGFGLPRTPIIAGAATQSGQLQNLLACQIQLSITAQQKQLGSIAANLISPGLYQFNVSVPTSLDPGDYLLICSYPTSDDLLIRRVADLPLLSVGPEIPTRLPLLDKQFVIGGTLAADSVSSTVTIRVQAGSKDGTDVVEISGPNVLIDWINASPVVSSAANATVLTFSGSTLASAYAGMAVSSATITLNFTSLNLGTAVTGTVTLQTPSGAKSATFTGVLSRLF